VAGFFAPKKGWFAMSERETLLSEVELVKRESRGLRGPLARELASESSHLSETGKQILKFHGSYQQEDRDLRRARKAEGLEPAYQFMTRSRVPGGVLSAEQYLAHDGLAGRYGNGTLRITTRQTIQLHGVLKGDLRATIRALNEALVTTLATCGDVVRNVVCCPAPEPGSLRREVQRAARQLSEAFLPSTGAYHEIWIDGSKVDAGDEEVAPDPIYQDRYLPRKFKTTIAFPDDNCSDVYGNDLGFVVVEEAGRLTGFNVLVGGGLGQTHGKEETYPRLADALAFVTPDEVLDVARAVVLTQRDHGNRENRRRARLKYLIDERGLDWFKNEVELRLGRPLRSPLPLEVSEVRDHLGWHEQGDGVWYCGVFVENGRIQDSERTQLRSALRRIARMFGPGVHLTPQQNLLLTAVPEARRAEIERILADHGVPTLTQISPVRRWALACPALPTCPLALAEAERALPGVLSELEAELTRLGLTQLPLQVRMTGCPNGCARPYTAELAFVGRSLGKYVVYVGGAREGTRLAQLHADLVPREHILETVRPLLERYARERRPDEGFGDFWSRVGPSPETAEVGS
jgi:sulfite reductase (ferredoxin)